MRVSYRKGIPWVKGLPVESLFIANSLVLGLSVYHSSDFNPATFCIGTIWVSGMLAYFSSKYMKSGWLNRWVKKFGFYPILWFSSFAIWFGDILTFSANAQGTGGQGTGGQAEGFFFNNIRGKINNILSTNTNARGATDIINFGFGILQLAMILYIAFSIFQAVKAQQQDEEWVQSAKVPLIVLFAVTAGDFAIGLI